MVVSVSGNVAREEIRRHVERLFTRVPGGEVDEPSPPVPALRVQRRVLDRPAQKAQM
jgi:predicted Zn-dependent peptidase